MEIYSVGNTLIHFQLADRDMDRHTDMMKVHLSEQDQKGQAVFIVKSTCGTT